MDQKLSQLLMNQEKLSQNTQKRPTAISMEPKQSSPLTQLVELPLKSQLMFQVPLLKQLLIVMETVLLPHTMLMEKLLMNTNLTPLLLKMDLKSLLKLMMMVQ